MLTHVVDVDFHPNPNLISSATNSEPSSVCKCECEIWRNIVLEQTK